MSKVICVLSCFLLLTIFCSISAGASFIEAPCDNANIINKSYTLKFNIVDNISDLNKEGKDHIVKRKIIVANDVNVANEHIYLKSGSSLIIKNGATLSTNGHLTIERGAKLYVSNGKLVCGKNTVVKNFGRIIVREDGLLSITNAYDSNGESSINLKGDMILGNMSVSKITKRIKKYDNRFNLYDYCLIYVKGVPTFYYCVGDVVTDYYYKYINKNLKRKGYSLNKVYNKMLYNEIKDTADNYLLVKKTEDRFRNDEYYFGIDIRFNYSFALKKLYYQESYAEFIPMNNSYIWGEGGCEETL